MSGTKVIVKAYLTDEDRVSKAEPVAMETVKSVRGLNKTSGKFVNQGYFLAYYDNDGARIASLALATQALQG